MSPETDLSLDWSSQGPKKVWGQNVGLGFSSFAVEAGRLYTMGRRNGRDLVYCLNAMTGEEIWRHDYEAPLHEVGAEGGPTATPTVSGDFVVTLSRTGRLYCFDKKTGAVRWSKMLTEDLGVEIPHYGFAGSPLCENNWVIVDAGKIVAFQLNTGDPIWETEDFGAGYSSPISFLSGGRRLLANFNSNSLTLLDFHTGETVSSFPWETSSKINVATPIIHQEKIFISSGFGMGCALVDVSDPNRPVAVWRNQNMHNHFNSCVLWEGEIYGFDGHVTRDEGFLTSLDFETGELNWRERSVRKGSLIVADGRLIALTEKGELVIAEASPEKYQEISRAQVLAGKCWTPPVLSGGRIYCRNVEGDVVCLEAEDSS